MKIIIIGLIKIIAAEKGMAGESTPWQQFIVISRRKSQLLIWQVL